MNAHPTIQRRCCGGNVRVLWMPLPAASSRREAELKAESLLLPGAAIVHDGHGAPAIEGSTEYLSISHSRTHLAVAICPDMPVGIDIETPRRQLNAVGRRVLSDAELEAYGHDENGLLRAWTLKEALYKAALTPGLDFRTGIRLPLGVDATEACVELPDGRTRRFDILALGPLADGYMALVRAKSHKEQHCSTADTEL